MNDIYEIIKTLNLNFTETIILIIIVFFTTIGFKIMGKGVKYIIDGIVLFINKKELKRIEKERREEQIKIQQEKEKKQKYEIETRMLLKNMLIYINEMNKDRKYEYREILKKLDFVENEIFLNKKR